MHVHTNYNLQLAAMGVGRDEAQEIAARRAAETRRRLSGIAQELSGDDGVVTAAPASAHADSDPDTQGDPYSAADGDRLPADGVTVDREHGRLFSARA